MVAVKRLRTGARRGWDYVVAACFLVLVSLIVAKLEHDSVEIFSDYARVLDGDTLILNGRHVRLSGIDAPELAQTCRGPNAVQPCGRDARAALIALIGTAKVSCEGQGTDKYRRTLATCLADDRNLNQEMVERGMAVAYGRYERQEKQARMKKFGLWTTEFDRPEEWRKTHDRSQSADPLASWRTWLPSWMPAQ
ncbi:thermonuclease family protein [Rhizobium sp. CFBP 8762]|uniref:thermonuclease family protein n=1 Tax=Rhizobium sp. CFBP 8762 TaxID=2775279 RepID=UPI00177BEACE|nr:thermonuclease family protein [Rhizobium sp. CFBP 8762]MBD8555853.1 thermonuclease family protein [Rhizobium sp. CFBP 8762]